MSFQWIVDKAEMLSMERKRVVGSTVSRGGIVRSVSRGGQGWKITVKLPDGMPWTDLRSNISKAEQLDKITPATLQLSSSGYSWLCGYLGDGNNVIDFRATVTKGLNTITLTNSASLDGGGTMKFRAGDFIQLSETGRVYTVAADCPAGSNTVTLHRPVLEEDAVEVPLLIGPNVIWNVICTSFPEWTLTSRNLVSWSGPFVFSENFL